MKPFLVGTYQLGYHYVDLWADPNLSGGSFDWLPGNSKCRDRSKMIIGMKHALWWAWGTLVHETIESLMNDLGCAYRKSQAYDKTSTSSFSFMLDHEQLNEISVRAGGFFSDIRKDFERAWKQCQKRKKH